MKRVGETLRELRNSKHLLIREVAASIKMDQTLLSKIERNERLPTWEQLNLLMRFYKPNSTEIILAYLSDKVLVELEDQPLAIEAIHLAEGKILKANKIRKVKLKYLA